jgi:hypothetical protein
MKNNFPNIYKALGSDAMRPAMQYAIIEDGKIVATNGKMIVVSDLSVYADNPEWAEGQVFDRDLLKWMAKKDFNRLECTGKGIVAHKSGGEKEKKSYSGIWTKGERTSRAIYRYPDKKEHIGSFPDWRSVIPNDSLYGGFDGINKIGFGTELLSVAIGCFAFGKEKPALKFEFFTEDLNKPVRITSLFDIYDKCGKQCVYLVPHIVQD